MSAWASSKQLKRLITKGFVGLLDFARQANMQSLTRAVFPLLSSRAIALLNFLYGKNLNHTEE